MPKRTRSRKGKTASREVDISKSLSYLLRHGAKDEGLELDEGGWANVADVLAWRRIQSLKVDLTELHRIVDTNDKQRYQLQPILSIPSTAVPPPASPPPTPQSTNPTDWRIRAVQGHSITTVAPSQIFVPILSTDADCPSLVVHGTSMAAWKEIHRSGGLKPMRRTHIHFATRLPNRLPPLNRTFQSRSKPKEGPLDEVISGMRKTSTVVIWVDVKRSLQGGVKWWRSSNDVILTEGLGEPKILGLEWIKWVEWIGPGQILYGTKVKDNAEVEEMERRMNDLGVGVRGERENVEAEEKKKRGYRNGTRTSAEQEEQTSNAVVKDHWDD